MEASQKLPKILVIHGPNLNMLGRRQPEIYGHKTLAEIDAQLQQLADSLGLGLQTYQSNHEGRIVEKIQQATKTTHGLIINPAAYTHTSIAIRDALLLLDVPIIEVHLSNISRRETFRRTSLIADVATARIMGFGCHGYAMALEAIKRLLAPRPAGKDSSAA